MNFLIFLFFLIFRVQSFEEHEVDDAQAKVYLKKFGYWPPSNVLRSSIPAITQEDEEVVNLREALKKFQEFLGLEPTGRLDEATKSKISQPRCGVPDIDAIERYIYSLASTPKWSKSNLTYAITNFGDDLKKYVVRDVIRKAFDMYSEVVPLDFTELPSSSSNADIKIGFFTGEHGDLWPFDGRAHATYPPNGKIHFDDDERWVYMDAAKIEKETHIDFLNIALHEIGHALGLEHIKKFPTAIMAPLYQPTLDSSGHYMTPRLTRHDDLEEWHIDLKTVHVNHVVTPKIMVGIFMKAEKFLDIGPTVSLETYEVSTLPPRIQTTKTPNVDLPEVKFECSDYFTAVVADDETAYIFSDSIYLYKIQNQRVVKKAQEGDFLSPWNYSTIVETGYIRNGSMVLLDSQKEVHIYDPDPTRPEKFTLRQGYPKKTPIKMAINGAVLINNKAYIYGFYNYLIYDEKFNNATQIFDTKLNFRDFPKLVKGGFTGLENGQKVLTLFGRDYTMRKSQIYTYDMTRKRLVEEAKSLGRYLKNCL